VKAFTGLLYLAALVTLVGCGAEPRHIVVQHLLVSFDDAIDKPTVTRTQAEAEVLANELYERALGGEDFEALVQQYTDDSYPGIYPMHNFDVDPDPPMEGVREFDRARMVAAFGDVGFPLKKNEIGMAGYDAEKSPYGWHIIKRLKKYPEPPAPPGV